MLLMLCFLLFGVGLYWFQSRDESEYVSPDYPYHDFFLKRKETAHIREAHRTFVRANKASYLASPQWRALRRQILARDNYTCQCCGAQGPLSIHHITYDRFMKEELSDLVAVCQPCHDRIHNRLGYEYYKTYKIDRFRQK